MSRPRIHALGSNGSGQLGIGHLEDVSTPQLCRWHANQGPSRPSRVSAGGNHTIVLGDDGIAWLAGGAERLRRSICINPEAPAVFSKLQFMHPHKFELVDSFSHIASTWEAITFVSQSGEVFTHGCGLKGELGLGGQCQDTNKPQLLLSFPPDNAKVVDLAACMSHVVAVLDNGQLWGWGAGRKGQLGNPKDIVWTPRELDGIPFKATRVVCGREYTYATGQAPIDQIILGANKFSISTSAPATLDDAPSVQSSWSSVFVLRSDGSLQRWGRNDRGQLGHPSLPPLQTIVVGSEHVVGLCHDGKAIAWGWNEHGNCGPSRDAKGNVAHGWNVLEIKEPVELLGAGCATSFLVSSASEHD